MTTRSAGALTGLRLLTRDEIMAAPDLASETVDVPEWGGTVMVRALDVNSRLAYLEYSSTVNREEGGVRFDIKPFVAYDAALAALGIVGDNGPLFSLAEIEELGSKNPEPIARIAEVVRRLSKMGAHALDEARDGMDPTNGASPSD